MDQSPRELAPFYPLYCRVKDHFSKETPIDCTLLRIISNNVLYSHNNLLKKTDLKKNYFQKEVSLLKKKSDIIMLIYHHNAGVA
jgi:hypothetical protein